MEEEQAPCPGISPPRVAGATGAGGGRSAGRRTGSLPPLAGWVGEEVVLVLLLIQVVNASVCVMSDQET